MIDSNRASEVQMVLRTPAEIDHDIAEYLALLDACGPESEVQRFLAGHVYFFNYIARHHTPIFSKVKLGSNYEVDFAFYDPSSYGVEWQLVEIEPAGKRLFTASGQQTAELTHAIKQVRDWREWIAENRQYARKLMPLIEYPFFYIFMGRRASLGSNERAHLRHLNYETRLWLEIRTLDQFAAGAESAKTLGRMQMTAYSHSEMARREPAEPFAYVASSDASGYKERRVANLLQERISFDPEDAAGD